MCPCPALIWVLQQAVTMGSKIPPKTGLLEVFEFCEKWCELPDGYLGIDGLYGLYDDFLRFW